MTDLTNEFSWSKSRDDSFKECKRKYYYEKYASWGGWEYDAPENVRQIYILKNLKTRHVWVGEVVHDLIHDFLLQLKSGNHIPLNNLLYKLNKRLTDDFTYSESGLYNKYPKKCGLVEHEYKMLINKDEWDGLFKLAEECITNFYNSDILKDIKKVDPSKWVFLENFLSFDFEGTKVYLKIDFAIKNQNNVILFDWKTGKERDVDMDVQLGCYSLYVLGKWNIKLNDITIRKYNAALDKEDSYTMDNSLIGNVKEYMRKSIFEMEELLTNKDNNLAEEKNFPKSDQVRSCLMCNFKKICELV